MESPFDAESVPTPDDLKPYVFPGERVVRVSTLDHPPKQHPPSGLKELYRLAQVKVRGEVGNFPPLASLALETTSGVKGHEELHLYEALFGRDSLRVAIDMLPRFPRLTRATILALAEVQGREYYPNREEEPGRIAHEVRDPGDPIAQKLTRENGWEWPYYGSVDATPEFIRTIAAYIQQTEEGPAFLSQSYQTKDGKSATIADALTAAINWVTRRMDANPEGLLEFKAAIPGGIRNQAWRDSPDAYFHSNGELANHIKGVASIEVQRVTYDALLDAAELFSSVLDHQPAATELKTRAEVLKHTILKEFWTEDKGGFFVLGTDRDSKGHLRQLKIRTSNMGHMLNSRLLEGDEPSNKVYREAIIRHLFSPEMLNVSGIRTLARDEKRFRPGAYHNGSVWLWDTHFIVKGLRRHGYLALSDELGQRLFGVIKATNGFPEYVRGDDSDQPSVNTRIVDVWDEKNQLLNRIEQPPQEVQAWSVAAVLALRYYRGQHHGAPSKATGFEHKILKTLP